MADVEHSVRLWKAQPEEMAAALPWLRATMAHLVALNDGILCVGRGPCDSFAVTFGRASDAVACALYLQLAPLDPFALRIGLHSVETHIDEDANRVGMNGAARLRDIAHGGQTVMSRATASLAAHCVPSGASLKDLGDHPLADLQDREGPVELCHPGLRKHFPPIQATHDVVAHSLPS
jgi:class 3 adenylate cyclase